MGANEIQHGGKHYQTSEYQHWDWVTDIGMNYLEGCATKYVSRWWMKNGEEDLRKAQHYVQKALELYEAGGYLNRSLIVGLDIKDIELVTEKFVEVNHLKPYEADICEKLATWQGIDDLKMVVALLDAMLLGAPTLLRRRRAQQGTPPPSGASVGVAEKLAPHQELCKKCQIPIRKGSEVCPHCGMYHPFGYDGSEEA